MDQILIPRIKSKGIGIFYKRKRVRQTYKRDKGNFKRAIKSDVRRVKKIPDIEVMNIPKVVFFFG